MTPEVFEKFPSSKEYANSMARFEKHLNDVYTFVSGSKILTRGRCTPCFSPKFRKSKETNLLFVLYDPTLRLIIQETKIYRYIDVSIRHEDRSIFLWKRSSIDIFFSTNIAHAKHISQSYTFPLFHPSKKKRKKNKIPPHRTRVDQMNNLKNHLKR